MAGTSLKKFKNESRLYDFDFSAQTEIAAGQTIASVTSITSTPFGLTLGSSVIAPAKKIVQVRISGGVVGIKYDLRCTVLTDQDNILEGPGEITVLL